MVTARKMGTRYFAEKSASPLTCSASMDSTISLSSWSAFSSPVRRSTSPASFVLPCLTNQRGLSGIPKSIARKSSAGRAEMRSEEHTSELQSRGHLVCRLLLEKKKKSKLRQESEKTRPSAKCSWNE